MTDTGYIVVDVQILVTFIVIQVHTFTAHHMNRLLVKQFITRPQQARTAFNHGLFMVRQGSTARLE